MGRVKPRARRLRKVLELVRVLLRDQKCFFCIKYLIAFRNGTYHEILPYSKWLRQFDKPTIYLVTNHHCDHNRENNSKPNHMLAHRECHKRYHNLFDRLMRKHPTMPFYKAQKIILEEVRKKQKDSRRKTTMGKEAGVMPSLDRASRSAR